MSLYEVASSWRGTPWCANSAVKGMRGGVSCHNLPRAILIEAGLLSSAFPAVVGDPNRTKHSRDSQITSWLDDRPEFERSDVSTLQLQPGDLLGIRIYRCVDHLGLIVAPNMFVHVLAHKHVTIDHLTDPTWQRRIGPTWRLRNV